MGGNTPFPGLAQKPFMLKQLGPDHRLSAGQRQSWLHSMCVSEAGRTLNTLANGQNVGIGKEKPEKYVYSSTPALSQAKAWAYK